MNWPYIPIKKVCLRTYSKDPRTEPEKPFLYVDISSIERTMKIITQTPKILGADAPSRARKVIKSGDILVSTVRPNLNAVAVVPKTLDNEIASTGFCVLRPNKEFIDGKYLFYSTLTSYFIDNLTEKVRGAHYPAVSDNDVKAVKIPLPAISEQRKIVEILDHADRLGRLRADADTKAQRNLPPLFYEMFGDPLLNTKGWPVVAIGDLLILLRNGTTAEQNQEGRGYPVTRIETISNGVIDSKRIRHVEFENDELDKWRMQPGDILFSHINSESHIGKTAIYDGCPEIFIHGMNLLLMRPNPAKVFPLYLFALLNTDSIRIAYRQRCKRAVNQASLNQKDISSLFVAIAPLRMQERFCHIADSYLSRIEVQKQSTTKIRMLFDTLLHRAFTGDLTARWRKT